MSQMEFWPSGTGDWVYVLTEDEVEITNIKIGHSSRPLPKRIRDLQTGNPRELIRLAQWRPKEEHLPTETDFHTWRRLAKYRANGGKEWYNAQLFVVCEEADIVLNGTIAENVRLHCIQSAMRHIRPNSTYGYGKVRTLEELRRDRDALVEQSRDIVQEALTYSERAELEDIRHDVCVIGNPLYETRSLI